MSEKTYLGSRLRAFETSPEFDSFTKVVIKVTDDLFYEAGTDSGRTLTIENPFGTQQMADDLVAQLKGWQYQPYTASDAAVDPAAELGDGITVMGVYSGIYSRRTRFGKRHLSEVAAPKEEEIDHEYPYVPKQQRKVERRMGQMSATLDIHATEISARVTKTGGDASSFGWTLDEKSWSLFSNGSTVLKATREGLDVTGKITATSGKIGGFEILSNRLSYNGLDWGGTNTNGVYLGPSGIQMGRKFRVDSAGNLYAASGTFEGNIYAGNIQYGGNAGYFNGGGLSAGSVYGGSGGKISGGSISTFNTSGGINTSLGNGDYSKDCLTGNNEASYIRAAVLSLNRQIVSLSSISYLDSNGKTATARVLKW